MKAKNLYRLTTLMVTLLLLVCIPCNAFAADTKATAEGTKAATEGTKAAAEGTKAAADATKATTGGTKATDEDYEATSMVLLNHKGTVSITDSEGKSRSVLENVRFKSGETMNTGGKSSASIELDTSRILTMDENTTVNFTKKTDSMELNVTKGEVLLDVQKKLGSKEKLDVKTSTMAIGIRGTVIAVEVDPVKSETGDKAATTTEKETTDTNNKAVTTTEKETTDTNNKAATTTEKETTDTNNKAVTTYRTDNTTDNVAVSVEEKTAVIGTKEEAVEKEQAKEATTGKAANTIDNMAVSVEDDTIDKFSTGENKNSTDEKKQTEASDTDKLIADADNLFVESENKDSRTLRPDGTSVLKVLEGTAEVTYKDKDGKEATVSVEAGNKIIITDADGDGICDSDPTVELLTDNDLTPLINNMLTEDKDLKGRVLGAIYNLIGKYSAKLDWTINDKITLTAQSASKTYDGLPLTRSAVKVEGLTSDFTIEAVAGGTLTNAGTEKNPVDSYIIYNLNGEDVTDHFTNIEKVDGQLVVEPAVLTIWTGSAEKAYDGTPLTNSEVRLGCYGVSDPSEPEWKNLSYVTVGEQDSFEVQILYGICGTVHAFGTNPLSEATKDIEIHAGEKLTVWLREGTGDQSIRYDVEKIKASDLPDEVLFLYADNSDLLAQACSEAGWKLEDVQKIIIERLNGTEESKNAQLVEERVEQNNDNLITDRIKVEEGQIDLGQETVVLPSDQVTNTDEPLFVIGQNGNIYDSEELYNNLQLMSAQNYPVLSTVGNDITINGNTDKAPNGPVTDKVEPQFAQENITANSAKEVSSKEFVNELVKSGVLSGAIPVTGQNGNVCNFGELYNNLQVTKTDEPQFVQENITANSAKEVSSKEFVNELVKSGVLSGAIPVTGQNGNVCNFGELYNNLQEKSSVERFEVSINNEKQEMVNKSKLKSKSPDGMRDVIQDANAGFINQAANISIIANRANASNNTAITSKSINANGTVAAGQNAASNNTDNKETTVQDNTNLKNTENVEWVDQYDLNVRKGYEEKLVKDNANIHININTDITDYSDRPLGSEESQFVPIIIDDSIKVTATGSQKEVGSSTNGYKIDWGSNNKNNFKIDEQLGTLKVTNTAAIASANPARQVVTTVVPGEPSYLMHVTFTSGYASKTYDGTPLTSSEVIAEGLPAGFTFVAQTEGSQTDAGFSPNRIVSCEIYDSSGNKVTSQFKNVEYVTEYLSVKQAPVTVTTGSDEKVYDGTALTCADASIEGLIEADNGKVTVTGTGTITNVGTRSNTCTINWGEVKADNYKVTENPGMLKVTARNVAVTTESASKVYDGTPLTHDVGNISGLISADIGKVTVTCTGKITDVGTANNLCTINWGEVNKDNYKVTKNTGTLKVTAREVTVTTESASKVYDGTPLTKKDASISGLADADSKKVTVTCTGTITDAGTAENTYTINWGTAKSDNYTLSESLGTLTVNPREVTVITESAEKVYNGSQLIQEAARMEGLTNADEGKVWVSGTGFITNVGTTENTYSIDWGKVNRNNYTLKDSLGTLTVKPREVTVITGSDEKIYDGEPLTEESVSISGLTSSDQRKVKVTTAGTITDVGTASNTYTVDWGTALQTNYTVTEELGTLEVTAREATVITESAKKIYDGTPLTCADAVIDGLAKTDKGKVTVTGTGTITEVGTTENTYTIDWGEVNKGNYTLTEQLGTLEVVEPGTAIIVTESAEKTYDGTPLVETNGYVEGLSEEDSGKVTVKGTGTITDVGSVVNSYTIDWGTVNKNKYKVTENLGTLRVTERTATVITESATRVYDGTALTCANARIEDLADADKDKVTVTGDGSLTDAGSASNTYTIDWGTAKEGNYTLTEDLGTLTVTARGATVTTKSAEKVYDGTALTRTGASISNLAAADSGKVKATGTGTITDVGSVDNTYKITWGEVNQDNYTLTEELGTLKVTARTVTVTTDSAEKVYDGEALTETGASISNLASADSGKVTVTGTGTITDVGEATNTYEIDWGDVNKNNYTVIESESLGTLKVTARTVTVTTDSAEKVYDGEALTETGASISNLASADSGKVKATGTGTITDVGEATNTYEIDWGDVNKNNYTVIESESLGTLKVTARTVTVTTDSAEKVYDGEALTETGASISNLASADSGKVTVTGTGTITDVGNADNTYTIDWGDVNKDNYTLTEELGTLKVTAREATVTTGSAKKVYDGTPLTCTDASINDLADADKDKVTVTGTGTITEVGTAENTYAIDWGEASKDNYTLTEKLGTLEVTEPGTVIITTESAEKTYDGTPLTETSATIEGLLEEDIGKVTVTGTGTITDVGSVTNSYTIDWGEVNKNKYTLTENLGTLKVNPCAATVITESATRVYDGTELTCATARIEGLVDADQEKVTVSGDGSLTDAGSATNTYTIDWGTVNEGNYTLTEELGTLTVTTRGATVTTESAEKDYDGTALTETGASISGLATADSGKVTVTGTGTITDVGNADNTYTIDWGDVNKDNYTLTEEPGTLTVTARTVTVTTESAEKGYDGEALTETGASISGLADADSGKVTVTGTGTITDVGNADNTYTIDWGDVNKDNYTLTEELGTLVVTPLEVVFDLHVSQMPILEEMEWTTPEYTGEPYVINSITGKYSDESEVTCAASEADAAAYVGTFNLKGEDQVRLTVAGVTNVGTYTLTPEVEFVTGTADNYSISYIDNVLEIVPCTLTITTESSQKYYDGEPLTCGDVVIDGLPEADEEQVKVTATGSITDAGETENDCTIDWGEVDSGNYTVVKNLGTLTVEKVGLQFDLMCYGPVEYDGSPVSIEGFDGIYLTDGSAINCESSDYIWNDDENITAVVAIFNLIGGDQLQLTADSVTEVGEYTIIPEAVFPSGKAQNYDISYTNNTLTITGPSEEDPLMEEGTGSSAPSENGLLEEEQPVGSTENAELDKAEAKVEDDESDEKESEIERNTSDEAETENEGVKAGVDEEFEEPLSSDTEEETEEPSDIPEEVYDGPVEPVVSEEEDIPVEELEAENEVSLESVLAAGAEEE